MVVDASRRLQSLYVPVGDGTRLAVDVWLPVHRIAAGQPVGTVVRSTRYHRAAATSDDDSDAAAGDLFNDAGLALVVVDARGTGASFGYRTGEMSEREIADCGEIVDWVAAQPWSNGRVGCYGSSYEGQAAELTARLGNPHLVAVAALFSPFDPYRELIYPGGCGTGGRYAKWMYQSQLLDGVASAPQRLAALTGRPAEEFVPPDVKPVDGPDGRTLLDAAIDEHQANADVHALMGHVPFRDDRAPGLDWAATAPASSAGEIQASGIPLLIRAGWLDGAFAAGALARFATPANHQQVEIAPWSHGGDSIADTLRPAGTLALDDDLLGPAGQDRRLVEFFARHVGRGEPPEGPSTLTFGTLGSDETVTVTHWPPGDLTVRRWHLTAAGRLDGAAGPTGSMRHEVHTAASTGDTNRWLAIDLGRGAAYPDREQTAGDLLTFTGEPLAADVHVLGFPVVAVRLATTGTDGAVFVYLEYVAPDGEVAYLTEGCLRFVHRATAGPADPGLGVPRTFARADARQVVPGAPMDLAVELLPVSARLKAGHRLRVAVAGHDASCFTRYGPTDETFTLELGDRSYLDLPTPLTG